MFPNEINSIEHGRFEIRCYCDHNILFGIYIDHVAAVSDGSVIHSEDIICLPL